MNLALSPKAKTLFDEELDRCDHKTATEVLSGMVCYAHWALRQAYKDENSIESRLRTAGREYLDAKDRQAA